MTLDALTSLLESHQADYQISIHERSFKTAAEGIKYFGIQLSEATPTLILKTEDRYLAVILCGNTRLSFEKVKGALGLKEVVMADPKVVIQVTKAKVGEVSLINPELMTVVDEQVLRNSFCYGGCGVGKATLKINTQDLLKITKAKILDIAEPR